MKVAFCLYKYFPYGGLQRSFMDVALLRVAAGDEVFVYTRSWQGEKPQGMLIREIPVRSLSNHGKNQRYFSKVQRYIKQDGINCVVGFNKLPQLDIYFASDSSDKARHRNWLQRLSARYRHFIKHEQAVFAKDSSTRILIGSEYQRDEYKKQWDTPDSRFIMLPPCIHRSACATHEASKKRQQLRQQFNIQENELLLLMIGSGFRIKGLDRALYAVRSLPDAVRNRVKLIVIGQDKAKYFDKKIMKMGLSQHVSILPGRDDIPAVMQAGDFLIHPAYREAAGKVILEAIVSGLPVIVTEVCGYAHHVLQAKAGVVIREPFEQNAFNQELLRFIESDKRTQWRKNGIHYGKTHNLYDMAEAASNAIADYCNCKTGVREIAA